jgi:spore coat polysaccharide biosynthesis protein SpsF
MELRGRATLEYLLEALGHCARLDGLVVATSIDASDDATAALAQRCNTPCFRGPLEDVALRMLRAGEQHAADAIVRISGDSPLLDPALVDQAVDLFRAGHVDLVTNVHPRSFPKGQSVEVIALAALRRAVTSMSRPEDREHVTTHLYAHPAGFSMRSFAADPPRPEVQLSIDDAADFRRCAAILAQLGEEPWRAGWRACVRAYDQVTALGPTASQ